MKAISANITKCLMVGSRLKCADNSGAKMLKLREQDGRIVPEVQFQLKAKQFSMMMNNKHTSLVTHT